MTPFLFGSASFCAVLALALILSTAGIGRRPGEDMVTGILLLQRHSELGLALWLGLFWIMMRGQMELRLPANLRAHLRILLALLVGSGLANAFMASSRYPDTVWLFRVGQCMQILAITVCAIAWAIKMKRGAEGRPVED